MIAEGVLEHVGAIFGLHVIPALPTGCLGVRAGAMMASMDRVEIDIEGLGGHGAMPNKCLDPVLAAAEIILALQSNSLAAHGPFGSGGFKHHPSHRRLGV